MSADREPNLASTKTHAVWQEFGGGHTSFWTICHDLWTHRELIVIFGLRDLKVRYRQTLIGVAWAVLQPLAQMLIFMTMFGLLGSHPAEASVPYSLVLLTGLLGWQVFAGTVSQGTNSLVLNQALVTKVYFPRICLPLSCIVPPLLDLLVSLPLLGVMLLICQQPLSPTAVLAPFFVLGIILCSAMAAVGLAALNALYRDVGFAVPFLLQTGFFLSPVVYETSALIPTQWRWLFHLNPLTGLLEGLRWSLLGTPAPTLSEALITLAAMSVITVGCVRYFLRVDRFLADRI